MQETMVAVYIDVKYNVPILLETLQKVL